MRQIKLLTALVLRNLYGINVFRHTKDAKAKHRYVAMMILWIFMISMALLYLGGLSYGMTKLGMADIVPAYLIVIASLFIFAFGIFKAGDIIFAKNGYEMLCSLPLSQSAIVVSRFLDMYVKDLILTVVVMLPGMVVYGYFISPGISFYLIGLIGIFLIPVLPLVVSVLIGTLIAAVSARMKHKSIAQAVLSIIFVVLVVLSTFQTEKLDAGVSEEMFKTLADTITDMLEKCYPPAVWLGSAMVTGKIQGLLWCVLLYLVSFAVMFFIVTKNFNKICRSLFVTSAKHNYHMETLKSKSIVRTLYEREFKRYFSSAIYVTNTIIGPIMATIMAGAILIAGVDTIQKAIPLPFDINGLIPFAFAAVFGMMTTTPTSISMEGKNFWLIKSLPVSTKMVLDSKILLNLSLMLPFYILSEILLILALKPGILELLWLLVIPAVLLLFACVIGITVNLHFYSFDWEREETVVKQSASAMLGGFAGMLVSVLCGGFIILCPAQISDLLKLIICLIILGITAVLYRNNNKVKLQQL